jgi:hypothetical protein
MDAAAGSLNQSEDTPSSYKVPPLLPIIEQEQKKYPA